MNDVLPPQTITYATHDAFAIHLDETPNNRRVSRSDRDELIRWLLDHAAKPSSQTEFSRRNYVRKTFRLDENAQRLLALPKKHGERCREVVTVERIVDKVEFIHEQNGHAGWDATWRDVSRSYYGIPRVDVIFIVKRCRTCADNPRKRSKTLPIGEGSQCANLVFDSSRFKEKSIHVSPTNGELGEKENYLREKGVDSVDADQP